MCEAFQLTAAERADQVALRTIGEEISITFAEYAERVARCAAGLHALGVRRGDTVAFMLTNRPEFHLIDAAAMHLGATPFSIYNTSSPEQIAYLLGDAANRVFILEAGFRDRAREAMQAAGTVEHVVMLDGARDDEIPIGDLEAASVQGFDFESAGARSSPMTC